MDKIVEVKYFFTETLVYVCKDIFFWVLLVGVGLCIILILLSGVLAKLSSYTFSHIFTILSRTIYYILVPVVFVGKWIMVVIFFALFFTVSLFGGMVIPWICWILLKIIELIRKIFKRLRFLKLLP